MADRDLNDRVKQLRGELKATVQRFSLTSIPGIKLSGGLRQSNKFPNNPNSHPTVTFYPDTRLSPEPTKDQEPALNYAFFTVLDKWHAQNNDVKVTFYQLGSSSMKTWPAQAAPALASGVWHPKSSPGASRKRPATDEPRRVYDLDESDDELLRGGNGRQHRGSESASPYDPAESASPVAALATPRSDPAESASPAAADVDDLDEPATPVSAASAVPALPAPAPVLPRPRPVPHPNAAAPAPAPVPASEPAGRVFGPVRELFTVDPFPGWDMEALNSALSYIAHPMMETILTNTASAAKVQAETTGAKVWPLEYLLGDTPWDGPFDGRRPIIQPDVASSSPVLRASALLSPTKPELAPELAPFIPAIFGNTVITKTKEDAHNFRRSNNGAKGVKIVALDGEVIDADGSFGGPVFTVQHQTPRFAIIYNGRY